MQQRYFLFSSLQHSQVLASNFLILRVLFSLLGLSREIKRVFVFPKIFSFETGCSIRLLPTKKNVFLVWCDFGKPSLVPS